MDRFTRKFAQLVPLIRAADREVLARQTRSGERRVIRINGRNVDTYWHWGGSPDAPLLFELHGGGMVLGFAAQNDALRQAAAVYTGMNVVGIDYCKAPEYPFPAAIDEVTALIGEVTRHTGQYGVTPSATALMGFSGGGTIAAAVTLGAGESGLSIGGLLLHYPLLNAAVPAADKLPLDDALPPEVAEAFSQLYADTQARELPMLSPLLAPDALLKRFPPTVIVTAAHDGLGQEGFDFFRRLKRLGVPISFAQTPAVSHGYLEDFYNRDIYFSRGGKAEGVRYESLQAYSEEAFHASCQALKAYMK